MFYFAYGSNMCLRRMRSRCPDCKYLGAAFLRGYKVVPHLYADLTKAKNKTAGGVLYQITEKDLAALDRFEGYPNIYTRKILHVDFCGIEIDAITYIMTQAARKRRAGLDYPDEYRRICSNGAKYAGIYDVFKQ